MNDLYWISVLGALQGTLFTLSLVSAIAALISGVIYLCNLDGYNVEQLQKQCKYVVMWAAGVFAFTATLNIFIPSKDDLYCIYGVGQTIDYLKSNKEAKQLPDKAIKAINIYLDNQVKQDSINNK